MAPTSSGGEHFAQYLDHEVAPLLGKNGAEGGHEVTDILRSTLLYACASEARADSEVYCGAAHAARQGAEYSESAYALSSKHAKTWQMRPSEALAAHREALRQLVSRYAVTRPRVYGSFLTGKDDETSDLDLLVDPTEKTTLFTLGGLQDEAETLLGIRVSVSTPGFLPTKFRQEVLNQAEPL